TEVPMSEAEKQEAAIPIFGDDQKEETPKPAGPKPPAEPAPKRKREKRQLVEQTQTNESTESSEDMGSISEAGEVENSDYQLPPLSILNEPVKQKTTSRAEVQKKGRLLENTLKNFNVNAKVTQIKIGPAVTQYEV